MALNTCGECHHVFVYNSHLKFKFVKGWKVSRHKCTHCGAHNVRITHPFTFTRPEPHPRGK